MADARIVELPRGEATVHVFAVDDEAAPADLATLSADERRRAGRFRFARDRSAFVATRAALRRRLALEIGTSPECVPLAVDASGRPRLDAPAPTDLDFNVSHTRWAAAVAVSRARRVGVDIEGRSCDRNFRPLVPDIMTARERTLLDRLDDSAFVRQFLTCWTRKEAVVKGLGVGLAYPLSSLDTLALSPDGVLVLSAPPVPNAERAWTVWTAEVLDGFTLSVALAGTDGPMIVEPAPDAGTTLVLRIRRQPDIACRNSP